ncbi:MAG: FtsX-like permease family protein, partial [Gemmatimonadaceae bacterium]
FGLLQLLGLSSAIGTLQEAGRGVTPSRKQRAIRRGFVVIQIAMTIVLLAASGIMIRTVQHLEAVRPGFNGTGVLTADVILPMTRDATDEGASGVWEQLEARLSSLPGVAVVAAADLVPLGERNGCSAVFVESHPLAPSEEAPCVKTISITPGYFEALQIPVQGRTFTWSDVHGGSGGVVVSRALAQRLWPNEDPIGKGIKGNDDSPPYYRVIGVAGDVHGDGLEEPPDQAVYFPLIPIAGAPLWGPVTDMTLLIRTTRGDPADIAPAVRRVLGAIAPDAPITRVRTMDSILAGATARVRFIMLVLSAAAAMALLLSGVGLYTVIAHVTAQRRGEISVRMALGASAHRIVRAVMTESLWVAGIGIALGLPGALVTTQLLRSFMFGVGPSDPVVLGGGVLLLIAIAVAAGYFPARKAAHISPVEVLR